MKIIFLNIYHAAREETLTEFVLKKSKSTDIFCFQEADNFFVDKLKVKLEEFICFRDEKKIVTQKALATAVFARKKYKVTTDKMLMKNTKNIGLAQNLFISIGRKSFHITNVHGIPQPGNKKDCPERIRQSKAIINHLDKIDTPKIIGGDFNLLLDTESIMLFEKAGYRNLIRDYKIKTTRSKFAWEEACNRNIPLFGPQHYADYVFVTREVNIKNFKVPDLEISDHLPLIVEYKF